MDKIANNIDPESDNPITVAIVNEFMNNVDVTNEYSLKELHGIISDIYKTKMGKSTKISKKNAIKSNDDDDKPKRTYKKKDNNKPKKKTTAYNNFIKYKMPELIISEPNAKGTERMKIAGACWSKLSEEEKAKFKPDDDSSSESNAVVNSDDSKTE